VYFSWINARVGYRGFELPLPRFVQVRCYVLAVGLEPIRLW
jgi:hypothetical protein